MTKGRSFLFLAAALVAAGCFGSNNSQLQPDPIPIVGDDENPPPGDDEPSPKGPQPDYGSTVTQQDPPPPISGGTLVVSKDHATAFAADPDRDQVYVVDLASGDVKTVALQLHDEPGRLALDSAGNAHVALRRGGAVVTIDKTGTLLGRRAACPAPRGIAYDATGDRLLVACEGGEVVSLAPAADGIVSQLAQIDRGLRDVVIAGTQIYVSRFREAEILTLDAAGTIVARSHPTSTDGPDLSSSTPTLGWRMIAAQNDSDPPILVHQLATQGSVQPAPGGYGAPAFDPQQCPNVGSGNIVTAAIWEGGFDLPLPLSAVLPVDVATDANREIVIAAGNGHTQQLPQIFVMTPGQGCGGAVDSANIAGQATAVALLDDTSYLVQSREPAMLVKMPEGKTFTLATKTREDTGHAIFHSNSGSGIACASCHGEGGDDGHVWSFDSIGARRTPSLRGTIAGTAPYHWGGEMKDVSHLVDDVLSGRMNGPSLADDQKGALQGWLFAIPAPIAASGVDAASAARGKALFESSTTQCTNCHNGEHFTNSATVDVGTGGAFQVPPLVGVSARLPLLHDGCAQTLEDRFGICATSSHGKTTNLAKGDVADLVAYLKTL